MRGWWLWLGVRLLTAWLLAAWLLTGCSAAAVAPARPVVISIAGATALQPVLRELTAEYTRQHPNVVFTFRSGGSTLGEEQALNERVTLGASTLFPPESPTPVQRLLTRTPIGIDGLAIIAHPSNPVAALEMEQLRRLYAGDALDWTEVGGEAGAVVLVSREDGSGARVLFEEQVMQEQPVSLTAVVMPSSHDVVEYVAKTPHAIGYVSRGLVMAASESASETPPRVRVVAVDGQLPTLDALRAQSYPLMRPMYLVSRGEPRGAARQFVDFVLGPAGQAIVARYHLPVR